MQIYIYIYMYIYVHNVCICRYVYVHFSCAHTYPEESANLTMGWLRSVGSINL